MNRCVIKASLENSEEVRRFALETKEFFQLYSILSDLFLLNENFSIRYKDDEGDMVLISNDIELAEAIIVSNNVIRVFIRKEGGIKSPKSPSQRNSTSISASSNIATKLEVEKPSVVGAAMPSAIPSSPGSPIKASVEKIVQAPEKPKADLYVGPFLKVRQTREQLLKAKRDLCDAKDRISSLKKLLEQEMKEVKKIKEEKMQKKEEEKKLEALGPKKFLGRFVKHVTIPDNSELPPNTPFIKTWRFRNEADKPWPANSQLVFVGKSAEDLLAEVKSIDVGTLLPGQETNISIPMKTPAKQGHYISYWRLYNPANDKKFGQRVWVMINVVCDTSSSSSGDERDQQEMAEKYAVALRQLHDMGFDNVKFNIKALAKNNGDLAQAVKLLVKKVNNK